MQERLYQKHKHCKLVINWNRTNPQGSPALCCAEHFDKKGRLQYLDWLNQQQLTYCIEELGLTQIHQEPNPHYRENSVIGNISAYFE
jgi:hypothetical protein